MRYNTRGWIERIQALIALHYIRLADGNLWVAEVSEKGEIHLVLAEPNIKLSK